MTHSPLFDEDRTPRPLDLVEYQLRERFAEIFSHPWDFIVKETPESEWQTIKKYKLTPQKLWYKYTNQDLILGVRFGKETVYGLYDLDWGSIYDPREQEAALKKLTWELENWGICRLITIQSSLSQGLHLCFHLERPINTFRLACVMNKAAHDAGLEIKNGQLETFPNTKAYNNLYQGHRLPLQEGSCLLDKDYTPYSERLEDFLDAADWSAAGNDVDLLESRLEEAYQWFISERNQKRYQNSNPEDREFIEQIDYAQREIKEGFFNQIRHSVEKGYDDFHQTNELLLTIAKLGRMLHGLSGERLVEYIRETIVSCPGYAQYCRHKHEILRRCQEVARWAEKKWSPYRSRPKYKTTYKQIKESLSNKTNLNQEKQHNAQSRIIQSIAQLQQELGSLPTKVGECIELLRSTTKKLFGISISDATLKKPENLSLWHPKYRDLEEGRRQERCQEGGSIVSNFISSTSESQCKSPDSRPASHLRGIISATDANASSLQEQPLVEEIKESETEEVKAVAVITEAPDSRKEQLESKPQPVATEKTAIKQQDNELSVRHKALHSKQSSSKQQKNQSRPCNVVRQGEPNRKQPQPLSSIAFNKTVQTLPYMKGSWAPAVVEIWFHLFQRSYCDALMSTPGLELLYQGYRGNGISGLVELSNSKNSLLRAISPNTEVEILSDDYHSSYFKDRPKQIQVYIKPLKNSQDWLGGIAVLIDQLLPLRIREPNVK